MRLVGLVGCGCEGSPVAISQLVIEVKSFILKNLFNINIYPFFVCLS